ncbi:MAG: hypothetical protein ABI781_01140 [Burkholderiales bacterium]
MEPQRAPRQVQAPDAAPSLDGRRLLYKQALRASEQLHEPQGFVALVLIEVVPATASAPCEESVLVSATTRLAELLNKRLRSVDVLVRSASNELAVLLTLAHMGVAAAFSERLRQPIEQALSAMKLADQVAVCMGLAANPPVSPWSPEALIELAGLRVDAAIRRAQQTLARDWVLFVDGASLPPGWADSTHWPATDFITSDSGF